MDQCKPLVTGAVGGVRGLRGVRARAAAGPARAARGHCGQPRGAALLALHLRPPGKAFRILCSRTFSSFDLLELISATEVPSGDDSSGFMDKQHPLGSGRLTVSVLVSLTFNRLSPQTTRVIPLDTRSVTYSYKVELDKCLYVRPWRPVYLPYTGLLIRFFRKQGRRGFQDPTG